MQLEVDNATLHYHLTGDGPPVLFVHGFPLSHELWRETAAPLSDWRCILPDLRGHGRSTPSDTITIGEFTDDLVALLDALNEHRPVVVCGLSMGGVIAFDFFRRYRDRTRALVLVDCRADAESPEGVQRREEVARTALQSGSGPIADAMIDKLFGPQSTTELRSRWRDIMAATPPQGVAAAARALAGRPDSTPLLANIDVPTLLVFGAEDAITPPELGRRMHAAIRGSTFCEIAAAGHLPPVEQPEAFVATMRSFLATL